MFWLRTQDWNTVVRASCISLTFDPGKHLTSALVLLAFVIE